MGKTVCPLNVLHFSFSYSSCCTMSYPPGPSPSPFFGASSTLPKINLRSLSISSSFRSAANSDIVWERFLPSDYEDIVSRSVTPLKFSLKKGIFVCLCDPILIDGGNKVFRGG